MRKEIATAAASILIACTPEILLAQQSDRYAISGNNVAVYNLAGQVTVERGSGSEVVVEVMVGGDHADELLVETGIIRGRNTLRIVYPGDRIVYREMNRGSRMRLRYRDDGTFSDDDRDRGRRVTLAGSGSGIEAHADLKIAVPPGQRITVYLVAGEVSVSGTEGQIYIDTHQAPVSATGTKGLLNIDVGSGSVSVERAEGEVEIDTGSGSVRVSNVNGNRLLVDTGSGSVFGADLTVTDLNVDTGSGSIELIGVRASDLLIDTGSGAVKLGLLSDVNELEVDTGSGGVTISIPESLGAEIEIDTGSGGIDVDFPLSVTRWERSYLRGRIGDGQGRIVIDTGSGGVRLTRS